MSKLLLVLLLALLSFTVTVRAQKTLGDRVVEAGSDWLIGEWEGSDDEGRTLLQTFSWDLGKHAMNSRSKSPRWEIKGTTGWDPEREQAVYVGFSDRGGSVKGRWGRHDGSPVLKIKAVDLEGRSWSGAVVYKKKDASTMEVQIFALKDDGELKGYPEASVVYKRK